ncbi:thioredoxin-like protein [Fimicolochytrium jonesii]|uniref:thioredoxin-like protein n=1 Tax=Fimicolochytrium jonesii TaxID=1396493 RepID=UPI0022FEAEE5|nr:thioredoxin-like protein [Fimicolochytrium jonesii]KAI8819622.1 thioredoxin-like protein [Fimicolochytrium jonesii]
MPARPKIKFYYDIVSPYSYVGWVLIRRLRQAWGGFDLELEPVFLSFVLSNPAVKSTPAAFNKLKLAHLHNDVLRLTAMHKFPMKFAPHWPLSTLKAHRMLQGIKMHPQAPEHLEKITNYLYEGLWTRDEDVSALEVLAKAAKSVGPAGEKYLAYIDDPDVKAALVAACSGAVEKGVNGTPTFIVTREDGQTQTFFGSDRFDHIAWFLGKPYPIPPSVNAAPKL